MTRNHGSSWDSGIWWLILGTSTGTLTTTVLYFAGSVVSGLTSSIKDLVFQYLARRCDISEHTFVRVSNMTTFSGLLQQLGLRTYRYMWLHEANAEANDSVQHGYIRIPTKSHFGKLLAFAHISHYIWISRDLDKLYIVGPTASVNGLIEMSNVTAGRSMYPFEVTLLRRSFGMDEAMTDVDALFVRMERRAVFCLVALGAIALFIRTLEELFAVYPRECRVAFGIICFLFLGFVVRRASSRRGIAQLLCRCFRRRQGAALPPQEESLLEMTSEKQSDDPTAVPIVEEDAQPSGFSLQESPSRWGSVIFRRRQGAALPPQEESLLEMPSERQLGDPTAVPIVEDDAQPIGFSLQESPYRWGSVSRKYSLVTWHFMQDSFYCYHLGGSLTSP